MLSHKGMDFGLTARPCCKCHTEEELMCNVRLTRNLDEFPPSQSLNVTMASTPSCEDQPGPGAKLILISLEGTQSLRALLLPGDG